MQSQLTNKRFLARRDRNAAFRRDQAKKDRIKRDAEATSSGSDSNGKGKQLDDLFYILWLFRQRLTSNAHRRGTEASMGANETTFCHLFIHFRFIHSVSRS